MVIKIMLDPGHGAGKAHNRGYVGSRWKNEGDGNYCFSLLLKKELESYGIVVGTTRNNINDNPSLNARGTKGAGYDLFLSLHTNAANGTAQGVEIYNDVTRTSGKVLAEKLTSTISNTLNITNRGVKYRYSGSYNWYGVLGANKAKAGMLIEHCFHDNKNDVKKYEDNAEKLAENMAMVIANNYGLSKSGVSGTNPIEPPNKKEDDNMDCSNRALIVYNNVADLDNAMPLIKWLEGSYIVDIINGKSFNKHDFKCYKDSNWRIAIGGSKSVYTSYINYHITGKDREETKMNILDFRFKEENRKRYKV